MINVKWALKTATLLLIPRYRDPAATQERHTHAQALVEAHRTDLAVHNYILVSRNEVQYERGSTGVFVNARVIG